jgi:hypothetical protein
MPTPLKIVTPTSSPTPVSGLVIDIAHPSLPAGELGRLFDVSGMRPGDEATAFLVIFNGGQLDLTYSLSIDATTSSLLDTSQLDDLQLSVMRCGATFTVCGQSVYAGRILVANAPVGGPDTVGTTGAHGMRPLTRDYLRMRVTFPFTAGNAFEGAHSILRFILTSSQAL